MCKKRVYTAEQKERAKIRYKKWHDQHPGVAKERSKKWSEENREISKVRASDWYHNVPNNLQILTSKDNMEKKNKFDIYNNQYLKSA